MIAGQPKRTKAVELFRRLPKGLLRSFSHERRHSTPCSTLYSSTGSTPAPAKRSCLVRLSWLGAVWQSTWSSHCDHIKCHLIDYASWGVIFKTSWSDNTSVCIICEQHPKNLASHICLNGGPRILRVSCTEVCRIFATENYGVLGVFW